MNYDLRCAYSPELHIAITGATGFVGSGIIRASEADFQRIAVSDIPSEAVFIHCSADLRQSREALRGNLERDIWLLEHVQAYPAGLIYASSNTIYSHGLNCRVGEIPRCIDYYSASKVLGEKLIQDMSKVPFCLMRIGDVFGVSQRHGNLFRALEQAIAQQTFLKKYGEGLKRRSYIFDRELAYFLLFFAKKMLRGEWIPPIVNVCYPESPTVGELIEWVGRYSGLAIKQVDIEQDSSSLDVRTMIPGPLMGYKLQYPSLSKAIEAYVRSIERAHLF